MQDVPARRPKLAAQDEFVEIVRVFDKLDGKIHVFECRFMLFCRMFDFAESLQGEGLFLDVLAVSFVDFLSENGDEKLARFLASADFLHCKEMSEPCTRMPVVKAACKKHVGWPPLAREHEFDECSKIFFRHG